MYVPYHHHNYSKKALVIPKKKKKIDLILNKFARIPNLHTPIPHTTINRHRLLPSQLSPLPFRPKPILPCKDPHTKHTLQQLDLTRQCFHFPFAPLVA